MAWRVANSLETLLAQVNAIAPRRSKASDGSIGDAAHAARKSDHNPNEDGVVTARDFTHDPAGGFSAHAFAELLLKGKDPRIDYVISNGRIFYGPNNGVTPWVWKSYSGSNPHTRHIHVSVQEEKRLYDDASPWAVNEPKPTQKFHRALNVTWDVEGGYSNHPSDPGGPTNYGITQGTYDLYRTRKGLPKRSVAGISRDEAEDIYFTMFWQAVQGDRLPDGLDLAVYDFAVHSGPPRAIEELQRALGVKVDGDFGPVTYKAVLSAHPSDVIVRLKANRLAYMRTRPNWSTFAQGWTARVDRVTNTALSWVDPTRPPGKTPPLPDPNSPTPEPPQGTEKTPKWLVILLGLGIAGAIVFGSKLF